MLLKKIVLNNFRQYKGKQEVVFSGDPEKNVTVLLGDNTGGKTTFVQAFRWVLYEDTNFTGRRLRNESSQILNRDVRISTREGDTVKASVELVLTHGGIDYSIERVAEYYSKESGDVSPPRVHTKITYYDENGVYKTHPRSINKINEILPQELSEYFFFDGEKIAKSTNRAIAESSINTIMGLAPIKSMVDHVAKSRGETVLDQLQGLMRSTDGSNINAVLSNLKRLNERKIRCENDLSAEKRRVKISEDQREEALERYKESEFNIKNIERLKIVEGRRDVNLDLLKRYSNKTIRNGMGLFLSLQMYNLYKAVNVELGKKDYSDKGIPDMTNVSIHHIMNIGKCVCGTDLKSNSACMENLKKLLKYLPPESIGSQIRKFNDESRRQEREVIDANNRYEDSKFDLLNAIDQFEKDENEAEELEKLITDKSADHYKEQYKYIKKNIEELDKNVSRFEAELFKINTDINSAESELNELARISEVNRPILEQIEYAKELARRAERLYAAESKKNLGRMRLILTEVFSKMYHGRREIHLSDNYEMVLSSDNVNLDLSKGLETVVNFAFIASLLKLAKERMLEGGDVRAEPYPLVMDAVFTNVDHKHIRNISRELPALTEQAVLALMDKEWKCAEETLSGHVGKMYRIKKISESESVIEEVG